MLKLNKIKTILFLLVITLSATFFIRSVLAEQSGSSPESGTGSILMNTYNELVSLGYGDESGSLGAVWNRIYNASTWFPDGTLLASDVVEGKTFYDGSRTSQIGTLSQVFALSCPVGMVAVPSGNGGSDFCVDKYEAKQSGAAAVSVATGTPWINITQYGARDACIASGKHLVTEQEWLQIAKNVEQVGWNWSGGAAGSGAMSDGHSDNSPTSPLAANSDDSPCSGTGQTCDISTWNSQRRTSKLSNGEYIWDFGGNVWDWVDAFTYDNKPYANNWSGWAACSTPDGICGNTLATNDERFGSGTTTLIAFLRGGDWGYATRSGAFSLMLLNLPADVAPAVGFRCAR